MLDPKEMQLLQLDPKKMPLLDLVYLFNTLIIVLFLLNLCRFYDFLYLSSQHHSNNAASCRRIGVMVHMIG
jgi:hypothetical protein